MKKIALILIAAVLLMFALVSCGGIGKGGKATETDVYDIIESISRALDDGTYDPSPEDIVPELQFQVYDAYVAVTGCKNAIGAVEIPAEYEGKPVTKIAAEAFAESRVMTGITLPEGLLEVGDKAFFGCAALTAVAVPDSVKKIGDYAFYGCAALKSANLGAGVETIGAEALGYCVSLAKIKVSESNAALADVGGVLMNAAKTLLISYPSGKPDEAYTVPAGVLAVSNFAFAYAQNLEHVTVEDSVTSLGDNTFRQCAALESATLGGGLTHIGANTFVSCAKLTKVTISEGPASVGYLNDLIECGGSFAGCAALAEISLPSTLTAIYSQSFSDCKSLKTINFAGAPAAWDALKISAGNDILAVVTVHFGK